MKKKKKTECNQSCLTNCWWHFFLTRTYRHSWLEAYEWGRHKVMGILFRPHTSLLTVIPVYWVSSVDCLCCRSLILWVCSVCVCVRVCVCVGRRRVFFNRPVSDGGTSLVWLPQQQSVGQSHESHTVCHQLPLSAAVQTGWRNKSRGDNWHDSKEER